MSDSRTGRAPGQIDGPDYFQHHETGHIMLPPGDSTDPNTLRRAVYQIKNDSRYRDYEYRKVTTLSELDELTKRMVLQEAQAREKEGQYEAKALAQWEKSFKDKIYQKLASSSTSEYEKEFLRLWLQLRDEKKKKAYAQRFLEHQCFFVQREMDSARTLSDKVISNG